MANGERVHKAAPVGFSVFGAAAGRASAAFLPYALAARSQRQQISAVPTAPEPRRLSVELERAVVRALRSTYDDLNATFFRWRLRRPPIELSDSSGRLGRWIKNPRALEIGRELLAEHGWGVVVEVLKHEMAHQYVDEVLEVEESAHGPAFREVCRERGFDARAAGVPETDGLDEAAAPILERIAKLLALAESPNLNEAQSAMNAAQRLMLKYNLESVQRPREGGYSYRHVGKPTGRVDESQRILAVILDEHFFVEPIWVPVWRPFDGKRGSVLEVCGTLPNLSIAEYVHSFLTETAERLWKEHKKAHGIRRNKDRRSFIAGVMSGFREKLARQKKQSDQQGLVWVGDAELHGYFRSRHPHVRTTRHFGRPRNEAHQHGRAAGRRIVLHKGMRSGPSSGPKLLRG